MPKILVIDDKRDNLISLSALLKALIPDCQVITAQSGAEGLGKAEVELPDTILLDIKMPGMDGYEVCKKLKENASTKHIPVIMISAVRTEAIDLVKGLDAGADAYLAKPIDECILAAQVKTVLRIKESEDQLRRQKDMLESMVQERTKELQRSLEILQENEKLYKEAQSLARLGHWEYKSYEDSLFWSDELYSIFEIDKDTGPLSFEDFVKRIHLEDRDRIRGQAKESKSYRSDYRIVMDDSSVKYIHEEVIIVRQEDGKVVLMKGTAQDITQRKQAELEILRFSRIFKHSLNEIYIFDSETLHFIDVNRGAQKNLGYSLDELKKMTPLEFKPEFTAETFAELVAPLRLGDEQQITFTTIHRRKDGTLYPVEVYLQLMPEAPPVFVAIILDITERKQAQNKLEKSEHKFRSMLESMSDPVYICSEDYWVEYMNPAMIKRVGRDATGEHCFAALHDFSKPCPWCTEKSESHGNYFESDIVSPKDNRSYHVSHSPIVREDGSVSNMTIFRDTTELKKLEAQLLQSQKMESIGNLAGGIAHDFNNILTVINIHSEVAQTELEEGSDLWIDVEEIRKAGERAANLTRQLLAFSRKQMITPRSVNINKLIADLGKMLARLVSEDVRLETVLDEQVGRIYADPGQLNQVIINLVVNARDAVKTQSGSKKIIKISTSQIFMDDNYVATHEGSSQGWHLQLQVEDSGCGMSEEVRDHIFEPFYTTKAEGEGTGMGLATVYGIVKQNKGSIYVYSEPGQGTIFKVYWPIIEEKVVSGEEVHELQPAKGGSEVILLAEDSQPIREIASRQLRKAGYTVIDAADGRKALEKAAAYQGAIDLLFTDVIMPVMGGKELSEKINELYPDILTLFASGYTDSDIHQDILTLGKNRFINKPYSKQDILIRIRQLLDEKKS